MVLHKDNMELLVCELVMCISMVIETILLPSLLLFYLISTVSVKLSAKGIDAL